MTIIAIITIMLLELLVLVVCDLPTEPAITVLNVLDCDVVNPTLSVAKREIVYVPEHLVCSPVKTMYGLSVSVIVGQFVESGLVIVITYDANPDVASEAVVVMVLDNLIGIDDAPSVVNDAAGAVLSIVIDALAVEVSVSVPLFATQVTLYDVESVRPVVENDLLNTVWDAEVFVIDVITVEGTPPAES